MTIDLKIYLEYLIGLSSATIWSWINPEPGKVLYPITLSLWNFSITTRSRDLCPVDNIRLALNYMGLKYKLSGGRVSPSVVLHAAQLGEPTTPKGWFGETRCGKRRAECCGTSW